MTDSYTEQTISETYPGPVLPARPDRWLEFACTSQSYNTTLYNSITSVFTKQVWHFQQQLQYNEIYDNNYKNQYKIIFLWSCSAAENQKWKQNGSFDSFRYKN